MRRALTAVLLLLLAAACQPVPRPFSDDRPPPLSPILSPPDSAGIIVLPVAGPPAAAALMLADTMAAALQELDVPASTDAYNRGSYQLLGTLQEDAVSGASTKLTIEWELRSARGDVVGRYSGPMPGRLGDKTASVAAAKAAAPAIAQFVAGDAPMPVGSAAPLLALKPITGAPGDGNAALARAMGKALENAHIVLASKADDKPTYVLTGQVAVAKPSDGKQQVRLLWLLTRPDGTSLGQVKQENAVPAGSLDGHWGDIAFAVASAAGPGIVAIIQQTTVAQSGH